LKERAMTINELEKTLRDLALHEISVQVQGRPGHLVATVSSPDFATLDEAKRQERVWEHLIEHLTDDQRVEVEFVFTLTPEEMRQAQAS
jgi:acid stress-induced BolA-like protein IbaG/YrbA